MHTTGSGDRRSHDEQDDVQGYAPVAPIFVPLGSGIAAGVIGNIIYNDLKDAGAFIGPQEMAERIKRSQQQQ
jgi:hypothetical protein